MPGEVPAEVWTGEPGDAFGAAVALSGAALIVASATTGEVELVGQGSATFPDADGLFPWFAGDAARVGVGGDGLYALPGGERLVAAPSATAFAGDAERYAIGDAGGVWDSEGRAWELPDVRALAVGDGRLVAMACGDSCRAWALEGEPGTESAVELGAAGPGGRVAIWRGRAIWSDPEIGSEDGAGRVYAEDGAEWIGLPGDFLGRALGGGYAAGAFNAGLIPPRARVVSLGGGETLALDRGAVGRPLSLSGDDGALAIGAPTWPGEQSLAGAVYRIERAELPAATDRAGD